MFLLLSSNSLMWFLARLRYPGIQQGSLPLKCFDYGVIFKNFHHALVPNQLKCSCLSPELGHNLDQLSSAHAFLKIEILLWWNFRFEMDIQPLHCAATASDLVRWVSKKKLSSTVFFYVQNLHYKHHKDLIFLTVELVAICFMIWCFLCQSC